MITLTENAVKRIAVLQKERKSSGKSVRVYAEAGCCSGKKYGLAFDEQTAEDKLITQDGIRVVIDPTSADLLSGSVIDYIDSPQGSGFKIENPNVPLGCDCGRSCH